MEIKQSAGMWLTVAQEGEQITSYLTIQDFIANVPFWVVKILYDFSKMSTERALTVETNLVLSGGQTTQ